MKNLYLTFFTLFIVSMLHGQQFSFNLYITDSLGHSDTLVLGYDPMATDSIDSAFGEVDIKSQVWDTAFETRICPLDDFYWDWDTAFAPSFETKKQIMFFDPQPPYNPYSYSGSSQFLIEIRSNIQRPFILSWDSTLFADSARYSSYLRPVNPLVTHDPVFWLSAQSSFVFQDEWMSNNSYYIRNNDTIWVLAFQFVAFTSVGINESTHENKNIKVYPNPSNDIIHFDFNGVNQNSKLIIHNSLGQIVKLKEINKTQQKLQLNISNLKSGIYYYHIMRIDNTAQYSGKFIKK